MHDTKHMLKQVVHVFIDIETMKLCVKTEAHSHSNLI